MTDHCKAISKGLKIYDIELNTTNSVLAALMLASPLNEMQSANIGLLRYCNL